MNELGLALLIPIISSCFAGFFSLPALAVLPLGLRWVFTAATLQQRWARLVAVITGSFSITALCGYWGLTDNVVHTGDNMLLAFTVPYLLAALASATFIYRPWLFRS